MACELAGVALQDKLQHTQGQCQDLRGRCDALAAEVRRGSLLWPTLRVRSSFLTHLAWQLSRLQAEVGQKQSTLERDRDQLTNDEQVCKYHSPKTVIHVDVWSHCIFMSSKCPFYCLQTTRGLAPVPRWLSSLWSRRASSRRARQRQRR